MTNDKREQARKYELYAAILERDANPLTPHGIANGLGAQLIRQRAAALLREAEAATAPDVSEAFEFQYCGNRYKLERTNTDEPWYTILVWRKERWEVKTTLSALVGAAIQAALRAARKREGEMVELLKGLDDAAEMLWATLANVSGGDWDKQSAEWRGYAEKWRDNYFVVLKQVLAFLAARETAALNEGAKNE